jgi:hypothetical protein
LQNWFDGLSVRKVRFFATDIFFALSFSVLFLNFINRGLKITEHLIFALLICVMATVLPPILRAFVLYFEAKPNGDAYLAWVRLGSVILIFCSQIGWFVINAGNEQQLVIGIVSIVALISGWLWYAVLMKREEKILWLWQIMLDIPLVVEGVVNRRFQGRYVRKIAKIAIYAVIPVLLFYQHFSKIVNLFKRIIKSSVVKGALKLLVIALIVLAGIIYSDYSDYLEHKSVVKDYGEKLIQESAQESVVDNYSDELMRKRAVDDYLDRHGLLSRDAKH